VNAEFVALEKGIDIKSEVLNGVSGYKNKVTITLTTEKNVTSISGTVFGEDEQRIVGINGFKFDFKPKGKMIIFRNYDVPGVIASITSILAKENINISDFRLGRGAHQFAMAVILVDTNIDKKIIAELNKLEACAWVEYAVL
jgi:D-3-phosphoglycerate dehydrogenase